MFSSQLAVAQHLNSRFSGCMTWVVNLAARASLKLSTATVINPDTRGDGDINMEEPFSLAAEHEWMDDAEDINFTAPNHVPITLPSSHIDSDFPHANAVIPPPALPNNAMQADSMHTQWHPRPSKVYGTSKDFMGRFSDDRFAHERLTNVFYPFSCEGDWQIASFLLRSSLSTREIDNFLSLPWVSHFFVIFTLISD